MEKGNKNKVLIIKDGETYEFQSQAEAARAHGVKPGTLSLRLKKGWTVEQALGLCKPPEGANVPKKTKLSQGKNENFSSVAEAARKHDLSPSLVHGRLHKGWSLEEALGIHPREKKIPVGNAVSVRVNDKEINFNSITEAAKYFKLNPGMVSQRVSTYEWTIEQALEISPAPEGSGTPNKIEVSNGGKKTRFNSLKAAVEEYGLEYDVVKQRINKLGWNIEQALELTSPPKHDIGCIGYIYKITNNKNKKVYIGQTKTTVAKRWEQHKEKSIRGNYNNNHSLHKAIQEVGYDNFEVDTLESARTLDELNRLEREYIAKYSSNDKKYGYNLSRGGSGLTRGKEIVVNGKKYESLASASRELGVSSKLVHQRINRYGWSIEQAFLLSPPPKNSSLPKEVTVMHEGQEISFISHAAAADYFNVPYKKFHSRLSKGWSISQALEIDSRTKSKPKGSTVRYTHNGEQYEFRSIAEAARANGVKPATVRARLDRGWSVKKSLGLG